MSAGPGLEGRALLNLAHRDIAAVVSPLTAAEVPLTEANLWLHEAVVEALMTEGAILPVRFGTVLASEAKVQAMLAACYASFVATLERVRGRVELGLRVLWEEVPYSTGKGDGHQRADSGREYLLTRLEEGRRGQIRRQRAETLAAEIHETLARLSAESTRQVLATPRLLLTAAYLIEREQMAAFQREVETLRETHPTRRFLCTGPWPPYSFVTDCAAKLSADLKEEAKIGFWPS